MMYVNSWQKFTTDKRGKIVASKKRWDTDYSEIFLISFRCIQKKLKIEFLQEIYVESEIYY